MAPSGRVGWTVVDAAGRAVAPAEAFLRHRFACEASPNTLRAYARDLKLFFGFLAERSLSWRELSPAELGEFVAWLRRPAGNVIALPGTPPARAASTVNRALSAVLAFYDFHRLQGVELADLMLDPRRGGRGGFRPFLAGIAPERAPSRRGRMPVARRVPRVLSLEQVARVVAAQSRLRDRLLFVLSGIDRHRRPSPPRRPRRSRRPAPGRGRASRRRSRARPSVSHRLTEVQVEPVASAIYLCPGPSLTPWGHSWDQTWPNVARSSAPHGASEPANWRVLQVASHPSPLSCVASHARGRWFETSRAHPPEPSDTRAAPDYVVRVGTPDLDTYETFVTDRLGAVPGIARVDSHLTMKVVKSPDRRVARRLT